MKKLISILVAFAMMASLAVCMAFAEGENYAAKTFTLTKELQMPTGTKTPAKTFNYLIEPVQGETAANTPAATTTAISFTSEETPTTKSLTAAQVFGGTYAPGKYVYTIKEVDASADNTDEQTFTFDKTQYKVNIYVDANNNKTYTLYEREGEDGTWSKTPAEGTGDNTAVDAEFENTYVKTTKVTPNGDKDDPSNDSAGYSFEKFIENDAGGLYTDKNWTFTVTFDIPELSKKDGYNYEIWTVGTPGENGTATKVSGPTKLTSGQTITLKAGQRAVFTDLDVGAKVNVKEADTDNITEGATLKVGTAAPAEYAILTGADTSINEGVGNYLKVTNTSTQNTQPEGILISNLPYIVLALVAIGGLVAYVVVRRRNADEA